MVAHPQGNTTHSVSDHTATSNHTDSPKDAAAISRATMDVLSRTQGASPVLKLLVEACSKANAACAAECEKHADHMEHCKTCAAACRATEKACRALV